MRKDNSITGWVIAFFVIMAAIIGYGIIFCNGIKNLAPWTDSNLAWILPIGVLCGLGMWVGEEIWTRQKAKKNQEKKD